jgi:surface antigen
MTNRVRQVFAVLLVTIAPAFLFGCESDDEFMSNLFDELDPGDEATSETADTVTVETETIEFSSRRRLITELSPEDLALHARTVYAALDSAEPDAARLWQSRQSGAEGLIVVVDTWQLNDEDSQVCRYFHDTLTFRGQTEMVADAACRRDGTWWWLRRDPGLAVLEGVPVAIDYYVIRSGGTLADVASVTGVPEDELMRLNPDLSGDLPSGTEVRLP